MRIDPVWSSVSTGVVVLGLASAAFALPRGPLPATPDSPVVRVQASTEMLVPANRVPLPRPRPLHASSGLTVTPFAPTGNAAPPSGYPTDIADLITSLIPSGGGTTAPLIGAPQPALPPAVAARTYSEGIPAADKQILRDALDAIFRDDFARGLALKDRVSHPVSKTLIEFYYVRDKSLDASVDRMLAFTRAHPDWPLSLIHKRMERAMLIRGANGTTVVDAFSKRDPETGAGKAALAIAYAERGETGRARTLAGEAWRNDAFATDEADAFVRRGGNLLTAADHKFRMDRLLYSDRTKEALRVAQRLDGTQRALAEARAAVSRREGNALSRIESLPAAAQRDASALFGRIQATRRAGRDEAAARLLLDAPRDPAVLVDPDEWWIERRLAARHMIEAGDARMAYRIASQHSAQSPASQAEAEFHAGWIALRFLSDPRTAKRHFERLRSFVRTPVSIARGEYWIARAEQAAGNNSRARYHFDAAAAHATTYYGQLAAEQLGRSRLSLRPAPRVSSGARRSFESCGPVMAMRLLSELGYQRHPVPFLLDLSKAERDPETMALYAELAGDLGLVDRMLAIGKLGLTRGWAFESYAFPTSGMPSNADYGDLERAFAFAIARQESTFNAAAVSPAGARGLMQLMPNTARQTARKVGVGYSQSRLTSDPSYNVSLGSHYLATRVTELGGSYILAAAAYNAGKSRAVEWVGRFGDPRTGQIDPVDWIELIPFTETRNYVQRVMENLQVYRAVLPGGNSRLRLTEDLRRGARS